MRRSERREERERERERMWPHQNRILSQAAPAAVDQAAGMKSAVPMVASSSNSSTLNSSAFFLGHKRSSQRQPPLLTNSEFGGKYVILEPLEASSLYMCIDKETLQEFVCKVSDPRQPCVLCMLSVSYDSRHSCCLFTWPLRSCLLASTMTTSRGISEWTAIRVSTQ